ncbi:HU family DNA-binding protein [Salipiger bermudensis]|uniref:HU family DNA-binding protein n=1 Tax=Salipiger bermudensis TaxID=344736 RepID=UPI003513F9B5
MTYSSKAQRSASVATATEACDVEEADVAPSRETVADDPDAAPDALIGGAAAGELDTKELVDRVVARCGVKKREAKPSVEAALAILGEALAEGRELRLEPFGKLKVSNIKTRGEKRVINARLRQNAPSRPGSAGEGPEAAED